MMIIKWKRVKNSISKYFSIIYINNDQINHKYSINDKKKCCVFKGYRDWMISAIFHCHLLPTIKSIIIIKSVYNVLIKNNNNAAICYN